MICQDGRASSITTTAEATTNIRRRLFRVRGYPTTSEITALCTAPQRLGEAQLERTRWTRPKQTSIWYRGLTAQW